MRILAFIFVVICGEFIQGSVRVAINPAVKTSLAIATVNNSSAVEPALQRWYDYTVGWLSWGFFTTYFLVFMWAMWPILKPTRNVPTNE